MAHRILRAVAWPTPFMLVRSSTIGEIASLWAFGKSLNSFCRATPNFLSCILFKIVVSPVIRTLIGFARLRSNNLYWLIAYGIGDLIYKPSHFASLSMGHNCQPNP